MTRPKARIVVGVLLTIAAYIFMRACEDYRACPDPNIPLDDGNCQLAVPWTPK